MGRCEQAAHDLDVLAAPLKVGEAADAEVVEQASVAAQRACRRIQTQLNLAIDARRRSTIG
jgi:hypothetical protein